MNRRMLPFGKLRATLPCVLLLACTPCLGSEAPGVRQARPIKEIKQPVESLGDGREVQISGVRAISAERDLAIVQLKGPPASLKCFDLRPVGELKQGDEVIAIGHPFGFRFTVTTGIIGAVRKTEELADEYKQVLALADDTLWVQTTAAIGGGSSGGPLLDRSGNLVGINTWGASGNLSFAVHVRHLLALRKEFANRPIPLPLPAYVKQLQATAEAHPKDRAGFAALMAICVMLDSRSPLFTNPVFTARTFDDSARRLTAHHLAEERMDAVLPLLDGVPRPEVITLVQKVAKESPHPEARGLALDVLAGLLVRVPLGHRAYAPEIRDLLAKVAAEYPGTRMSGASIGKQVERLLFAYNHLVEGAVAPDIAAVDHQGDKLELRQFRGKVTVLDFWVDWCPYCRKTYPIERELVQRLAERGRPSGPGPNPPRPARPRAKDAAWRLDPQADLHPFRDGLQVPGRDRAGPEGGGPEVAQATAGAA